MDSYFLSIDEDIFISIKDGVKYEYNDLAKKIVLINISKSDSMHVKHCETTKEMLDRLHNLYLGGKSHFSELQKNAKDSTFIALTNQSSSQEEDEFSSDRKDEEQTKIMALEDEI